jgi:hypothetical protein
MKEYRIETKTTNDILTSEWNELTAAFNIVFNKHFTDKYFKNKYFNSAFGYSFHSFLYFRHSIVGMFSSIPRKYYYNNKEINIALACDSFILKEHRKDEYFLKNMLEALTDKLKFNEITHLISIPNKTAYPYWIYYTGWKDISKLNYYVVPINIFKLIGRYKFIDLFSNITCRLLFAINDTLFSSKISPGTIFLKKDRNFISQRYNNGDYHIRQISKDSYFVYRLYNEKNIKTAYLIDCHPLSPRIIHKSLKSIAKENKGTIDLIMSVGIYKHKPFYLLQVPSKYEPREQNFIGLSLDQTIDNDFFSIDKWNICLADFDNR